MADSNQGANIHLPKDLMDSSYPEFRSAIQQHKLLRFGVFFAADQSLCASLHCTVSRTKVNLVIFFGGLCLSTGYKQGHIFLIRPLDSQFHTQIFKLAGGHPQFCNQGGDQQ
jgi:hypothetical protein